jgi:hypothetical protein
VHGDRVESVAAAAQIVEQGPEVDGGPVFREGGLGLLSWVRDTTWLHLRHPPLFLSAAFVLRIAVEVNGGIHDPSGPLQINCTPTENAGILGECVAE